MTWVRLIFWVNLGQSTFEASLNFSYGAIILKNLNFILWDLSKMFKKFHKMSELF